MDFDDNAHQFKVKLLSPAKVGLDFGAQKFVTSLTAIPNYAAIEATASAGTPLFGNPLVPPAIEFSASCVVPGRPNAPLTPAQLAGRIDFGFVQGIMHTDLHLEYWGQRKSEGRAIMHITMPGRFEVDTATVIKPWTRIVAERCKLESAPTRNGVKVSASFRDHPLFTFNHTVKNSAGGPWFIRSISCQQVFRTIFCFRDRGAGGTFTAISSTDWKIEHNHSVKYTNNGANRTVTDNTAGHPFPSGGDPSNVNADDHSLMGMAKDGTPLLTPEMLDARLGPNGNRTLTFEDTNADFDASFWQ